MVIQLKAFKRNATQIDRLSVFSFIWAVTTLIHLISFTYWIDKFEIFSYLTLLAALAVVLFPRSLPVFTAMLFCSICKTIRWMPEQPNHMLFELIINISIFSSIIWQLARKAGRNNHYSTASGREDVFNTFAPIARIGLIILYSYAVFHKLNRDFLNPDISCSTFLLAGIAEKLPVIPVTSFTKEIAVWGTLFVELAIPVFLIIPKTCTLGILLGFALHAFFALHPHMGLFSFSSLMYALYFLFTPAGFSRRLAQIIDELRNKSWRQLHPNLRLLLMLFPIAALFTCWLIFQLGYVTRLGYWLWSVWALVYVFMYVAVMSTSQENKQIDNTIFTISHQVFYIFPFILLINGLSPYLGLKTQTSFSMFSNLRTEGKINNHLFMPKMHVLSYQDDLIEIKSSDAQEFNRYVEDQLLITNFEFRRIASDLLTKKDYKVEFIHNDVAQKLEVNHGKSSLTALTEPYPLFIHKMVRFRPVDKGPVCLCKH